MDFDSLSCPSLPAAPVSPHSNISEVPKNHKIAGDGGKPLQLSEMPSGICVHLSRDAAPLKPPGLGTPQAGTFLQLCPKPRALDGELELELPFPAGSRCPHPAGTFPLASCSSSGSRVACCAASPHTSCTSNISKVGKRHGFRMQPELSLCPCPSLFQAGCLWEWCGTSAPGCSCTSAHTGLCCSRS